MDAGQVQLPPYAAGALSDPTQTYLTPRPTLADSGSAQAQANWQLLLPVDGSLFLGVVNNPANAPFAVTNQWLYLYLDGLLTNRAGIGNMGATSGAGDGPAWTLSVESGALPNPGHSGGGPGTQATGSLNVNSGADPYVTLDATAAAQLPNGAGTGVSGQAGAVNMLAASASDGLGNVLALAGEVRYSPLYLYPR